jgi:hypothetical protein
MSCIERRPRCGDAVAASTPDPLVRLGSLTAVLVSLASSIGSAIGSAIEHPIATFVLMLLGASCMSALVVLIVILFAVDNCAPVAGSPECVAGVVSRIVPAFSDLIVVVAPWMAQHDRVDVIVKSRYWDVVESGQAHVLCTAVEPPRRSEILRSYFKSDRVCQVNTAAIVGAIIGAIIGIIIMGLLVAAVVAALVVLVAFVAGACVGSWGVLCPLAIIAAVVVGAVIGALAALIGAAVAGLIVMAVTNGDPAPTQDSAGTAIQVGDLITVHGNMLRRDGRLLSMDKDDGANVLWWVTSSSLSGKVPASTPSEPFSYCDIDEVFPEDECGEV